MVSQDHSTGADARIPGGNVQPGFDYDIGLNRLLQRLEPDHPRYAEVLTYQQRLIDNLQETQLHGDSEVRRAGRAAVLDSLNRLSLDTLGVSFNEMCRPSSPPPLPPPPPKFEDFKFHDRMKACKSILRSGANHIELYGPRGVGKTYLLQHIADGREGIRDVYINLAVHFTVSEILPEVVAQLTGEKPQSPVGFRDFAMAISNLYKDEEPVSHFIFLFDSAEGEEHRELINWLISPDGLINNEELYWFLRRLGIRRDDVRLQVVIASRDPFIKVENYHSNLHLGRVRIHRLIKNPDPDQDAIQGMLKELAEHKNFTIIQDTCREISDEVYYITGGHPKCAKLVLFAVADVRFLPLEANFRDYFKRYVLPTVEGEMLCTVPSDLIAVFRVLSAFRRFDQRLLATLTQRGDLDIPASVRGSPRQVKRLRKRLVGTFLVSEASKDEPMFTMNFTVRRALSLRMKYQTPERYRKVNQVALEIFGKRLLDMAPNPQRSVISLIEVVYHHLKILEVDTPEGDVCAQIKGQVQALLEQLLKVIDEDDRPTYLPVLRDSWHTDEELEETMKRVVGNDHCYKTLSRQIDHFVEAHVA